MFSLVIYFNFKDIVIDFFLKSCLIIIIKTKKAIKKRITLIYIIIL